MLDGVAAMTRFLRRIAAEPDIATVPVMVDSSKWSVHRGRPPAAPGQGRRQLDLAQGGRGRVPPPGPPVPALRRGGRRHGVRRAGPGRVRRAAGRRPAPRVRPADRRRRLRARGHHPRRQHLRDRDRDGGAQRLRGLVHRGRQAAEGGVPRDADVRRRVERLVRVPRQRPGPRGDPLGLPVPRDRRPASTWRSSTPASCRSTTTSSPSCASGSRTWSSTAGPTPRSGCSTSPSRYAGESGHGARRRGPAPGASGRSTSG